MDVEHQVVWSRVGKPFLKLLSNASVGRTDVVGYHFTQNVVDIDHLRQLSVTEVVK